MGQDKIVILRDGRELRVEAGPAGCAAWQGACPNPKHVLINITHNSLLLLLLGCWALLKKITQTGTWCHHRFVVYDLCCLPKRTEQSHRVSSQDHSRPYSLFSRLQTLFLNHFLFRREKRVLQKRIFSLHTYLPQQPSSSAIFFLNSGWRGQPSFRALCCSSRIILPPLSARSASFISC